MDKIDIFDELLWFTMPILEAASNEVYLVQLFKEFGYEIDSQNISSINQEFKSVTNKINVGLNSTDDQGGSTRVRFEMIDIFTSIKSVGDIEQVKTHFGIQFFTEFFDYLLFRYLSTKKPFILSLIHAFGVVQINEIDASIRGLSYTQIVFKWSRISDFIKDNPKWAKEVYGWKGNPSVGDTKSLDYELLLNSLVLLLESTGFSLVMLKELTQSEVTGFITNNSSDASYFGGSLPLIQNNLQNIDSKGSPVYSDEAGFKILPFGDYNNIENLGFAIAPYLKGAASGVQRLSDKLSLNTTILGDATGGAFITINPSGIANNIGGNINGVIKFEFIYAEIDKQVELLKIGESTKVEFSKFKFIISGNIKGELSIASEIDNLVASIDLSNDGLLSNLIREPIIINAGNLLLGWNNKGGVFFEGGNNLALQIATHIELGPITITRVGFTLDFADKTKFTLDVTGNLDLGVLKATIEQFGITTELVERPNGLFGKYDLAFDFKPPNGLGLSINTGAVIGGGYLFFDFEKEEYAGALELTIAGIISVKAIGLITTKMPDGRKGFSMLIIITAEFFPPFQLGYGFTLNAVGGLLGLNRTVLLDPLRDGVRTGAVNNIMFPTNVIANAPRIISDLKAIFPAYEGKFLIGPMAKIGWGTPSLITLSFGLIIEIPGNIAILGVLKLILPDEKVPVVKIQVAFVGTIDFDKKMLTFDASLYESNILQTMTLEGDMAIRLAWGDQPNFIMTVGGFHPAYNPPPLALPSLRRLSINILNTSIARIRVECYQAVTSNTVQFGARAELYFDLSGCTIDGNIGFDALLQFNPFYFIISASANFKLSAIGIDVMSVRVRLSLEGPTPWKAKGTGSVSVVIGEISADFNKTWGQRKTTSLPPISILPKFLEQIEKKENWSTVLSLGKNLSVSLRKLDESDGNGLVLHPAGSLMVLQKLLPLEVEIEKIGNQKTADVKLLKLSASSNDRPLETKAVKENFARAQFQNLTDAQKLSKPSFEKLPGGIEISTGEANVKNGKMVRRKIAYELTVVDQNTEPPKGELFSEWGILFSNFLDGNSVSKSVLSQNYQQKFQPFQQKMDVQEELFTVALQSNNQAYRSEATRSEATFQSEMEAQSFLQREILNKPDLKTQLHIIPQYELQKI